MRLFGVALMLWCCQAAFAQSAEAWTQVLPTAAVELRDPHSISLAPDDLLYIADTGHHRVIAIDAAGNVRYETGGFGMAHGQFQWPRKVIANRGAAVWVLDYGNRRIEKFSRALEYQGTFVIPSQDGGATHQIEEFAVSPQGDLYVFDRDGGRLVRYDPLFRAQGEIGRQSGADFVSAISRMTYTQRIGLVWWERGGEQVRATDPLFTSVRSLHLDKPESHLVLAASDSCVLLATSENIRTWCDATSPPALLFDLKEFGNLNVKRLDDLALADDGSVYLLDGLSGALYRLSPATR